jgi:AcrR family transcriptional regulator
MSTLTQVAPEQEPTPDNGLRSRKKSKTRLAIENAALDLFTEKGYEQTTVDEITERAEGSKATFFRYFSTKADVIFSAETYQHEALHRAIAGRPAAEGELVAIRQAVLREWVPLIDSQRVARQGRAAATSPLLRGLSLDLGLRWQSVIAGALAGRRGLELPDQRCWLIAGMSFAVFSNATKYWLSEGGDLATAIDDAFELLFKICSKMPPRPAVKARQPEPAPRIRPRAK